MIIIIIFLPNNQEAYNKKTIPPLVMDTNPRITEVSNENEIDISNNSDEQSDFANWLYKSAPTCKENSAYCLNMKMYSLVNIIRILIVPQFIININLTFKMILCFTHCKNILFHF